MQVGAGKRADKCGIVFQVLVSKRETYLAHTYWIVDGVSMHQSPKTPNYGAAPTLSPTEYLGTKHRNPIYASRNKRKI
jgi:hypothetical protein